MPVLVLLCGEGPTDYGAKEYGTNQWQEGPVQPITRKTAAEELIFKPVEKHELKKLRIQRGPRSGHAIKSYKLSVIARKQNINTVICYVDADKLTGKGKKETVARESFQVVYNQVKAGFIAFNQSFRAGEHDEIRGIPMVPLGMIECWLMSDREAFTKCFGKPPTTPPLPRKPEFIWGEK
ncbi:MAG: hypothetical protein GY940_08260, partial [bacterium]|nr:hypothetical protein [bacterium]